MTGDGFVRMADIGKMDGGVALRHVRDYAYVGGRPLGAAFDIDDNLYIANALTGLQRVNKTNPRVVEILAGRAGGKKIAFADDLCIGNSGTIYFTDACSIGPTRSKDGWETLHPSILEGLRGKGTGRVLSYSPQTQDTKTLLEGLLFANGIAVDPREEYVFVCETLKARILRIKLGDPDRHAMRFYLGFLVSVMVSPLRNTSHIRSSRDHPVTSRWRCARLRAMPQQLSRFIRNLLIALPPSFVPVTTTKSLVCFSNQY